MSLLACDPVMSGETNVFSLRDRAGKPSVTIETQPISKSYTQAADEDPAFADAYNHLFYNADPDAPRYPPWANRDEILGNYIKENRPDLEDRYQRVHNTGGAGLRQIKGFLNAAPSLEDRPAITDFLRTQGPFSFGHTPSDSFGGHTDLAKVGLAMLPDDRIISLDKLNQGALDYGSALSVKPQPEGAFGPLRREDMRRAMSVKDIDTRDEEWDQMAPFFQNFEQFAKGGLVVRRAHGGTCGCPDCGSALTVTRRAS